jgi:hypothetical protein
VTTLVIACEVMREELLRVPPDGPVELTFLSMGLHVAPERLRATLAGALDGARGHDRVVLGFGLCGNAIEGLVSPHASLVFPRVHDCIPLLAGEDADAPAPHLERGIFYLSGGWMEGERTLASEHRRAVKRFGEEKARRILGTMLGAYERLVYLRTDHPRAEEREREAEGLARLLRLPLEARATRRERLRAVVNGPWTWPAFARVDPGVAITAEHFR